MKRQKCQRINHWIATCLLLAGTSVLGGMAQPAFSDTTRPGARAEQMFRQHQWDGAFSLLTTQLRANPGDRDSRARLIHLYGLQGNAHEAIQLAEEVISLYPEDVTSYVLLTEALFGPLPPELSANVSEPTLQRLAFIVSQAELLQPEHPGTLYMKGLSAQLEGNTTQAEAQFLKALYANPHYLQAQYALISLYDHQNEVQQAISLVKQLLETDSDSMETCYLLGLTFLKKGDAAKALPFLKQSREADLKDRPERLMAMAAAYEQLGQIPQALDAYRNTLAFWPERADLWERYARMLEEQGRSDDALTAYHKAYRLQPTLLNSVITDAERTFWTHSPAEAIPQYQRILKIDPKRDDILTLLIALHYHQWMMGIRPTQSTLDELEKPLRILERQNSKADLQMADIQLQVMRANHWTPGLQQVLADVSQRGGDPFLQSTGALLRNRPADALPLVEQLADKQTTHLMQRLVLSGAWPWALRLVETEETYRSMGPWVQTWSDKQMAQANKQLEQAKLFLSTRMTEPAIMALQKTQGFHPLSVELQIRYAALHLLENRFDEAETSLKQAKALGIPASLMNDMTTVEKQMARAREVEAKQEKQHRKEGITRSDP